MQGCWAYTQWSHCLILSKKKKYSTIHFHENTEMQCWIKENQNPAFHYCEEWHFHHLSNPLMILTKTSAAKFPNFHGSAGSNITASSDTWQNIWEQLTEIQVMLLPLHFKGSMFLHPCKCQLRQWIKSCALAAGPVPPGQNHCMATLCFHRALTKPGKNPSLSLIHCKGKA